MLQERATNKLPPASWMLQFRFAAALATCASVAAHGAISCQDDFQGTTDLGGRGASDQRLGMWKEGAGHAHLLCQGMGASGNIARSTCEFNGANIGFKAGWQSSNEYGEARWNLVNVNGQQLSPGTVDIHSKYTSHKICGDGSGGSPYQFGDAMVIENKLVGAEAKIIAYAFLNDAAKDDVLAGEQLFSVAASMGACKMEFVVVIPVKTDGDTTYGIDIWFHKDEGEAELNNGLSINNTGAELVVTSDLQVADGSTTAMTMSTGVICGSTKQAVSAGDIALEVEAKKVTYTIKQSAAKDCDFLYWDPLMAPFGSETSGAVGLTVATVAALIAWGGLL